MHKTLCVTCKQTEIGEIELLIYQLRKLVFQITGVSFLSCRRESFYCPALNLVSWKSRYRFVNISYYLARSRRLIQQCFIVKLGLVPGNKSSHGDGKGRKRRWSEILIAVGVIVVDDDRSFDRRSDGQRVSSAPLSWSWPCHKRRQLSSTDPFSLN